MAAISHRIGEIHALMSALAPAPTAAVAPGPSGSGEAARAPGPREMEFSAELARATRADAAVASTPTLTAAGVPVELSGYGNGRVPAHALAAVAGTSALMWGPAAAALEGLLSASRRAGHTIDVTDGYRDLDGQIRVARDKGLYSEGGLAAEPGTSQHGWGLAADLRLDPGAQAWMRAHAHEHGFVEAVPREPWHWEYRPRA